MCCYKKIIAQENRNNTTKDRVLLKHSSNVGTRNIRFGEKKKVVKEISEEKR